MLYFFKKSKGEKTPNINKLFHKIIIKNEKPFYFFETEKRGNAKTYTYRGEAEANFKSQSENRDIGVEVSLKSGHLKKYKKENISLKDMKKTERIKNRKLIYFSEGDGKNQLVLLLKRPLRKY